MPEEKLTALIARPVRLFFAPARIHWVIVPALVVGAILGALQFLKLL